MLWVFLALADSTGKGWRWYIETPDTLQKASDSIQAQKKTPPDVVQYPKPNTSVLPKELQFYNLEDTLSFPRPYRVFHDTTRITWDRVRQLMRQYREGKFDFPVADTTIPELVAFLKNPTLENAIRYALWFERYIDETIYRANLLYQAYSIIGFRQNEGSYISAQLDKIWLNNKLEARANALKPDIQFLYFFSMNSPESRMQNENMRILALKGWDVLGIIREGETAPTSQLGFPVVSSTPLYQYLNIRRVPQVWVYVKSKKLLYPAAIGHISFVNLIAYVGNLDVFKGIPFDLAPYLGVAGRK